MGGWAVAFAIVALAGHVVLEHAKNTPHASRLWLVAAALALATGLWAAPMVALGSLKTEQPLMFDGSIVLMAAVAGGVLAVLTMLLASSSVSLRGRAAVGTALLAATIAGPQWLALVATRVDIEIAGRALRFGIALAAPVLGSALVAALCMKLKAAPRRSTAHWQAATLGAFALTVLLSQHLALGVMAWGSAMVVRIDAGGVSMAALVLLASVGSIGLLSALWLSAAIEARSKATLAKATSALRQQSFNDPVTGLSNRQTFETLLAQAVKRADESQGRLALLFFDLDGFKTVNETYGHQRGDGMLKEIANRLRAELRPGDAAARLGGDQFLVLLGDSPRADDVARRASALLAALGGPADAAPADSAISCSIGIALYPVHGALSMLISHADAAMRAAKANGGGAYCFFEPHMVSGAREQVELLRDLRNALSAGQLELYYQPKIHGPSGEITGAEALMRWHHPLRGMISPVVFIPIAERFGLINTLGEWVIDEACRQARIWRDQGLRMRVAINLSVHQLRQPLFAESIAAALARYQVNPKLLTCEITESVAMEDTDHTMRVFSKLAEVGVHISIDDFGTGYSSLASLRKLPAEELKIDRSFVLDLETSADARAVVDAVVKLAHALGLKVVAEGVETEQQHQILRSLGCHELQGFLFAKPMSAKALSLWAMGDVGPKPIAFRASLFSETMPSMEI